MEDNSYNFDSLDLQSLTSQDLQTLSVTPYISNHLWQSTNISPGIMTTNQNSVFIDTNGLTLNKDCDIKIGDRSLRKFMDDTHQMLDSISERINVLTVRPELEQQWQDLQLLGQQYRKLEKEILEKIEIWNQLNK